MADVNANIGVNLDASNALAQLKALQREIATFHSSVAKSSEAASLAQQNLQRNFINGVNSIGAFSAELRTVKTTAESFTDSLEKNKFSMREYFRYAGASTRTFGRAFRSEFDTIEKVAVENVKRLQTQYIKMGRDASGAMRAIAIMPTELNMQDLATKTQIAAQKQAIFNQLIKQGSTNLLNFGKNTQWAGRQLMVGFTLPLMLLGRTATKTFMDMETAAIKFRKVYGDLFTPTAETDAALASIKELGRVFTRYGIAVSETVSLASEAAAAGYQGIDLQRQTTEATRLQVLGQIDAQKALETTISLQNAFQMQSKDLADAINFLNAVENQTVVSLDDITTAIPKAAPVVKQLGGDVKDLAFFMAAMKEGGINASEGANALKSGLASLINPTNKAKAMMLDFGIDIDAIVNKNAGNVKATVIEFATALDGLSNLNRQRAIEQLFGKFQLARLSTLFENVTKSGNQASRVLDLATASTEDLAVMAEKELGITADSAMNKFKKSVEELKVALVPVGQVFLEVITPFIEKISELLAKFNELSPTSKKIITTLVVGIGGIAPVVLMTIGLFANFVANGIKGLNLLRNGFLRLTGQSQILGEQTNYLTVEQQNALAAAHSLDQSHAKLIQRFNVEAGAIAALVEQYRRMIVAQNRAATNLPGMLIPGATRGSGPKRFSSGTTEVTGGVPGKDSVFSVLTPGEAVIPEPIAQDKRFKPIVKALVSGKIIPVLDAMFSGGVAKYATGTDGASPKDMSGKKTVFFDFDDTLADTRNSYEQWRKAKGLSKTPTLADYDLFSDDILSGKTKVPGPILENITKLQQYQKDGLEVQILSARKNTEKNRAVIQKVLDDLGIKVSGINLKDNTSLIEDKLSIKDRKTSDAMFKRDFLKKYIKDTGGSAVLVDNELTNISKIKALKGVTPIFAFREAKALAEMGADNIPSLKFAGKEYSLSGRGIKEANTIADEINAMIDAQESDIEKQKIINSYDKRLKDLDSRAPIDGKTQISAQKVLKHVGKKGRSGGAPGWVKKGLAGLDRASGIKAVLSGKETRAVYRALIQAGIDPTSKQMKNALQKQASHIFPVVVDGEQVKWDDPQKWERGQVVNDLGILNNYLNRIKQATFQKVARDFLNNNAQAAGLGIDKTQLLKDLDFAASGKHPTSIEELRSVGRLANLDNQLEKAGIYNFGSGKDLKDGVYQAKGVSALTGVRGKDWYKNFISRVLDLSTKTRATVLATPDEAVLNTATKTITPVTKRGRKKSSKEIPVPFSKDDTIKIDDLKPKTEQVVKPLGKFTGIKGAGMRYLPGKADAPYVQTESGLLVPKSATTNIEGSIDNLSDNFDNLSNTTQNNNDAIDESTKKVNKSGSNYEKMNRRLNGFSILVFGITSGLQLFGVELGGVTDLLFKLGAGVFAAQAAMMVFSKVGLKSVFKSVATGVNTFIGGKLAATVAKGGKLASFARIGVAATRLLTPMGWLTTGITLLGTAIYAGMKTRAKEKKRVEGLGNAALIAGEKLKGLGDYFGVATKTFAYEAAAATDGSASGVPGQVLSEIAKFRESDEFKKYTDDVEALKAATKQEAQILLEGIAIQLDARGFSKGQIALIIESLKQEAGRTDIKVEFKNIDISTKEGRKRLDDNVSKLITILGKKVSKGVEIEIQESLNFTAKFLTGIFGSLQSQLENGVITIEQYGKSVGDIVNKLYSMKDTTTQGRLLNGIFETMGKEANTTAGKINNLSDKLMFLQLAMLGVDTLSEGMIKGLNSTDEKTRSRALFKLRQQIQEAGIEMSTFNKMWKELTGGDSNGGGAAGGDSTKGLSATTKKIIDLLQKQVDALEKKRDALKSVNDEIDRQFEFQKRQMDLESQITEAKISGNYIQAAMLTQEKLFEKEQFDRETKEITLEARIDKLNERIKALEGGAKLTDAEKRMLALEGKSKIKGKNKIDDKPKEDNKDKDPKVFQTPTKIEEPKKVSKSPDEARQKYNDQKPKTTARVIPSPPPVPQATSQEYYFNTKTGKWEKLARSSKTPIGYVSRKEWMQGKKTYAQGGLIKGPGTGTSDSILAMVNGYQTNRMIRVSNGEYVLSEKAVKNAGGPKVIDSMHQYFRKSPKFKDGGEVKGNKRIGLMPPLFTYPKMAMGGYINLASLPKFKNGITNVPYDMPAILHQNERVLTAEENKNYGNSNVTISPTFNITGNNSDEIVNKVMVKLDTLAKKNNSSNRVGG